MDYDSHLKEGTLLRNDTYRIVKVLGQGGFGITYLAVHVRLKKKVAIKEFFPKAFCDRDADTSHVTTASKSNSVTVEKLRNKFIKEAEHIAEMDSQYIVKIIDVFEENHTAYYIMDYIEGMSLSDMVKRNGPLPVERAAAYITKIGEALTYIHEKRINHLDVKPANIMVRAQDDAPVLIDFGLSKQYDSEGNQTSTTPVGISHGYAPIEQYRDGGVKEFSPQTDLYSLAATLYYLLTGVVPPQASMLVEDDLTFPQPFPRSLEGPIRRAMSSARKRRHESIGAFVGEVRSAVDHRTLPADSDGRTEDIGSEETVIDAATFSDSGQEGFGKAPDDMPVKDVPGQRNDARDEKEVPVYKKKSFWFFVGIIAVLLLIWIIFSQSPESKKSYYEYPDDDYEEAAVVEDSAVEVEVVEALDDYYICDTVAWVEDSSW